MTQLVTILSTGKGSWAEVAALINKSEFDEVYILTNSFGKEKFTNLPEKKIEIFVFDFDKDILLLSKDFYNALKQHMKFGDIAINMSSGDGKTHMALFSAMIKMGVGIRLVGITNGEVIEL
jgi:hypothetical protein